MNQQHIEDFAKIQQPPRDSYAFFKDLQKPITYAFRDDNGCHAGTCANCMQNGIELKLQTTLVPDTALASLKRVLSAKNIQEIVGKYPIIFQENANFAHEEYQVHTCQEQATITAADEDGFRRAIYFLEDKICAAQGKSVMPGNWRRMPFVQHRISRCFFGPTNRAPFFIDELMNNVDYYPEEYLNKLAHEGVNGLWLTMYFKDLPSSIMPNHGKDATKRLAKLKLTTERCARYGIRIYLFFSEPKYFGNESFAIPFSDASLHPELIGGKDEFGLFCTSTSAGKKYIEESVEQIFQAVPNLGGIINIMLGEDNGCCASQIVSKDILPAGVCPICSKRNPAEIYREMAECFTRPMHKYNPNAVFIGWFYAPGQRDGTESMQKLLQATELWPDNAILMFNFESGGTSIQLGKKRIVFDYSLAYVGPSQLFATSAKRDNHMGAKLQVCCSHENASVPFIPVPENLYDKYVFMHEHGVSAAMQCWYFGNYPGLMNKAAGELSFEPFPTSAMDFLVELARPEWQNDAEQVAMAWELFSKAYRMFPSNIAFAWYGPLHDSIAWPLHLFPVDAPISPSWLLQNYPEVSGDRIGECLGYLHNLQEALELCSNMSSTWQKGLKILQALCPTYTHNAARLADIDLADTIGLQMKSTVNLLQFYSLREDMLYNRHNNLEAMKQIVLDEIKNTRDMKTHCEKDSRLGYHSEAEGYLFFPEKLQARIALLNELLTEDFPKFNINDTWIDEYTGRNSSRKAAFIKANQTGELFDMGNGMSWEAFHSNNTLHLIIHNAKNKKICIDLAPCRMWPPLRIVVDEQGNYNVHTTCLNSPVLNKSFNEQDLLLDIDLAMFDGFRRPNFPMQFNIHTKDAYWVEPNPWPSRLTYEDFNPNDMSWLHF